MTTYRSPNSDSQRLTLLRRAYKTGIDAGSQAYLSQETLAHTQTLAASFEAAFNAVIEAKAQQTAAIEQARAAADDLTFLVQNTRRTLRLNAVHGKVPMSTLVYYGLQGEGRLPQPARRADWLTLADRLLTGDERAQAAGLSALPERSSLAAAYTALQSAEDAVAQAKHDLIAARDLLQNQRQLVTEQISALVRELRYKLASQPFARQREIMRTYGLRFGADGKDEAGDAPAADVALSGQTGARPLSVAA